MGIVHDDPPCCSLLQVDPAEDEMELVRVEFMVDIVKEKRLTRLKPRFGLSELETTAPISRIRKSIKRKLQSLLFLRNGVNTVLFPVIDAVL